MDNTAKKAKQRLKASRRREAQFAEDMGLLTGALAGMADAVIAEISFEEQARVAWNWEFQPGVKTRVPFLYKMGLALHHATEEQAAKLKEAFPSEWEKWDGVFDPKTGAILTEGE